MRGRLLYGALAIVIMVAVAACDETLSDVTGPTPNLEPTFSSIQTRYLQQRRLVRPARLHPVSQRVGGRFNGLDLRSTRRRTRTWSDGASRGNPGAMRVIPGDPENSYLIHKLEGRPASSGRGCRSRPALPDRRADPGHQALDRARRAQRLGANT